MRGSLDHVYVNYSITQLDGLDNELPAHQDFVNATGAVLFMPGQRSEVCVPCVCVFVCVCVCVCVCVSDSMLGPELM